MWVQFILCSIINYLCNKQTKKKKKMSWHAGQIQLNQTFLFDSLNINYVKEKNWLSINIKSLMYWIKK